MQKIGVALGGGGVAGLAHIGVLRALDEAGIQIHSLAGSSAGAIIAALYAYGYSPRQLNKLIPSITKRYLDYDYQAFVRKLIHPNHKIQGLIRGERLHSLLSRMTHASTLSQIQLPLALLAVDLKQARQVIFSSHPLQTPLDSVEVVTDVPLADAIQASFSIPVLFKPVIHQQRVLVDGGVIDNCPVAAARALGADKVIAVDLVFADPVDTPFDSIFSVLARVVSIGLATQLKNTTKGAEIVLRPEVGSVGLLDFSQLSVSMEAGYQHAKQRMDEIKESLFGTHFPPRSIPRYRQSIPLPRKGRTP